MKNIKIQLRIQLIAPIAVVLIMLSATSLKAQSVEIGIRFMPTISSFDTRSSGGGTVQATADFGFGIGAFLGLNITNHFGLQGEVIYTSLSQTSNDENGEQKINLQYINIPVLFSLNTDKSKPINFNVSAGPQLGFNVGSSLATSNDTIPNDSQGILSVKKTDIGFAYGAGVDFGLNEDQSFRLGLGFRGVYGLFDVSDQSESITTDSYYVLDRTHVKTYSAYLGLSYMF